MTTPAAAASQSSLVIRRLYRSLLKTAKPFCSPNAANAKVLSCLLHRTGLEDASWEDFLRDQKNNDGEKWMEEDEEPQQLLFQRLLREAIAGDGGKGIRQMLFPAHVSDTTGTPTLSNLIRREFKELDGCVSDAFDISIRKQVAFVSLRELNKKLTWADTLQQKAMAPHPRQAARFVSPLPSRPPSSYLRPGAFLIAHPNLTGYFRRTVVCILDHTEEGDVSMGTHATNYGTYGLIVNRFSTSPTSGKNLTLEEVLRPLPDELLHVFGSSMVREGGPVHMSLQMLHATTPDQQEQLKVGGIVLPMVPESDSESTAVRSDRAILFKGDVVKAALAVVDGLLDRDDVSFFVGASSWAAGQLESEMERGCWLPCRGPPDISLSGICDHAPDEDGKSPRPKADLWLSMLSACGEDEAKLAQLTFPDDGICSYGLPCDEED
jgi:putative AlgH/UPF0301 family transcriptional regulator